MTNTKLQALVNFTASGWLQNISRATSSSFSLCQWIYWSRSRSFISCFISLLLPLIDQYAYLALYTWFIVVKMVALCSFNVRRIFFGWCRNLPFGGRVTWDSRVRLPREENARSCHQCLFVENVRKTDTYGSTNFKYERFGSCFYTRGRYKRPMRPSQGMVAFNQMCKIMTLNYFYLSFLCFFYLLGSTKVGLLLLCIHNCNEELRPT